MAEKLTISGDGIDVVLDEVATLRTERDEALDFIARRGYRRCDTPACNCGSYHGGDAEKRLREISELLSDNGTPQGTIWAGVKWQIDQASAAARDTALVPTPPGGALCFDCGCAHHIGPCAECGHRHEGGG